MTSDFAAETSTIDPALTRAQLETHLAERRGILSELEPRALPTVDPVAYQTAEANRQVVTQIEAAIARLDAGVYGRCNHCGKQIAAERLEIIPYAVACVACQHHAESA